MKKRIVAIVMTLLILTGSAPATLLAADPSNAPIQTTENGSGEAVPETGEAAQSGVSADTTEGESTGTEAMPSTEQTTETTPKNTETEKETETETEKTEEEKWLEAHGLKKNADGMYEYTDENGVLWTYFPEDPELFRLFADDETEFEMQRRRLFSASPMLMKEDPFTWRLNGNYKFGYPQYYKKDSNEDLADVHYGVDVSYHQGTISPSGWQQLKDTYGIDFVFIRAGFRGYGESGSLNADPQFAANIQNAAKAGLAVGVYYFSQAITIAEAQAEADHCMQLIAPYKDLVTLPVVIDYEYAENNIGRLFNAKLNKQAHTDIANAFCKRVQDNGYLPAIYANKDMLMSDMVLSNIPAEYRIWMANWPEPNSEGIIATSYRDRLSAWQYTGGFTGFGKGTGGVGIFQNDKVDLNFWYGDLVEEKIFDEAKITSAKAVSTPDPTATATDMKANKTLSVEVQAELPGKLNGSDGKVYLATINQVTDAVEYIIPSSAIDCPSKSETVTISVPLDNSFDRRSGHYRQCAAVRVEGGANKNAYLRLYMSKLALAVKNADGTYTRVSDGMYVSNPGAIAYTADYQSTSSKKGIQSADHIVGDGIDETTGLANNDLGVSHVFLNLYISDVFDAANGEIGWYEYNGESYPFSSLGSYLNTIRRCNDAGIAVTLQVMLDDPSNISKPGTSASAELQKWMINSKARNQKKTLYSWENNTRSEREVIEAAFSYLGEAFGTLGAKDLDGNEGKPIHQKENTQVYVSDWVLGNEVNSCDAWQYRGTMTDEEFFASYAQTYRSFYNAIKSVNSDARVYICTDNAWNQRVAGFTAKETVDRVATLLNEYDPTTDWNLAFHPYPHPLGATAFWTNADVTQSVSSPFINMSNLNVLTDYISTNYGKSHRIILSEQGFSSGNGENLQAGALVHAYYLAATNPMIDAFEIRSYEDEKLEILQGTTMGLTSRKNGSAYTMKEAYTAYKYCDDPRPEAKKFMDDHAYYKVVNSSANGWGDVSNPYYDASTFDSMIYRTVPETPTEPEQPTEPEEPPVPATYTVSFDVNGGTGSILPQTVTEGETVEKPEDPKRTGYTFMKWVDASGAEYDFAAPVNADLSLKATWEAKTDTPYTIEHYKANVDGSYPDTPSETEKVSGTTDTKTAAEAKTYEGFTAQTVQQQTISGNGKTVVKIYYTRNQVTLHFDSKGGTTVNDIKAPFGSAVTAPTAPEKTGYTFKGWDPAMPSTMPSADLTLTAQWEINTYTVKFDTAGGDPAIPDQRVEYQQKIEKPADPKKMGYEFVQWLDGDKQGYDFDSPVTGNLNLTAQWTEGETGYTVEHYLEKLGASGSYDIDEEAAVAMRGTTGQKTKAVAKAYAGFTPESFAQETIAANGSTVVKIYYQRNTVTLQFVGENDKILSTVSGKYQSTVNAPADPKRAGYTFAGWDGTVPETFPSEDRVIRATWTANTDTSYTVEHYKANVDGTYSTTPSETQSKNGTTDTKTAAEANTYDGFTAQPVQQQTISGDGKTVVKIYYTRNEVTLHFESKGGTTVSDIKAPYGSAVETPSDPKRTGYTFKGWDPAVPDKMPMDDLTVSAQWEINTYTVKFDSAGGSAVADQTVNYDSTAQKPETPKKEGYVFVQWLGKDQQGYDFNTPVTSDLTLTAQWTAGETGYTVEHYLEKADKAGEYEIDGTSTLQMRGTTGTKTAATSKTYAGFTSEGVNQLTIAANGSTVVKIYYKRNTVTLHFLGDNNEEVATLRGKYDTQVARPTDPKRAGYTFTGWDQNIPAAFPAADQTYQATWQANTDTPYTVKHYRADLNGIYAEKLCETETGLTGTTGAQTNASARSYEGFTAQPVQQQTISGDGRTVVKIYYTRDQATLHFDSKGGTVVGDIKAPYESEIIAPADPKRTGYTFKGWDPAVPEKMPLQDLTLSAKWQINTYTVQFDTDGGETTVPDQKVEYLGVVSKPEAPKKKGYTFVQWMDDNKKGYDFNTSVTGDVKLTAQWTEGETEYTVEHYLEKINEAGAYDLDAGATVQMRGTTGTKTEAVSNSYRGFIPETFTQATIAADGSTTVKIYYRRNTVTLKFLGEGGKPIATVSGKYQDKVTAPSDPKRTGYTFAGWDEAIPATFPADDATFTAQWKADDCKVTFLDEDGKALSTQILPYDTKASDIMLPQTPEKEKDAQYTYTFKEWTPALKNVTGDISYRALYTSTLNAYRILFTDGTGKTIEDKEFPYGTTPKLVSDPKREGYTFTGFDPAITPVKGTQIYVTQWKPISYQIDYDLAGGENASLNPSAYTIESAEITFAAPKRTGYNFEKWVDETGKTVNSIPSGSTGNRKLKAVWTKAITYAINYDLAGGENASQNPNYYTVESGALTLSAPKRTGYTFTGWTGTDLTSPTKSVTIPAKSTGERSYTANWSKNSYTVKFDKADGSANAVTTLTIAYGDPITKPANPTREGYDFADWNAQIPSMMPAQDLTFTAKWNIKTFKVTFVDSNNNPLQYEEVEYGENTSYKGEVPKHDGEVFIGWSLNGQSDTKALKQLHDEIKNVKQEYRYQAVYTTAPSTDVPLTSTANTTMTGTPEATSDVDLNSNETQTLDAFTNTALVPAQVKSDVVLAEIAQKCAAEGKENDVQTITNITLEIKTVLRTKTGSGSATVYTFEISPFAVAKNGTATVAEAELDQQALSISASNTMVVKIPVLMQMLFATITHYPDDNESDAPETFTGVPVQEENGERFAAVPIGHFSRFKVQKGAAQPATVPAQTGASGSTSGTAAGSAATGSAAGSGSGNSAGGSASLNGTPVPSVDLTLAQQAAIGMATLQQNVANAFANLFGNGKNEAAETQTTGSVEQTGGEAAEKTDDAAADTDMTSGENPDLTEDFRTAEAGDTAESGQDTAEMQTTAENDTDANAPADQSDQKKQGITVKPGVVVLIVLLVGVGAAFVICQVVLFKNKQTKRHKKKH